MENAMTTLEFFQANQIDKLDGQVFTHNIDDLVDEMKIKNATLFDLLPKTLKSGSITRGRKLKDCNIRTAEIIK